MPHDPVPSADAEATDAMDVDVAADKSADITAYPARNTAFDVLDVFDTADLATDGASLAGSDADSAHDPSSDVSIDVNMGNAADATPADDEDGPIITDKDGMYIFMYNQAWKAWDTGNYDKANSDAQWLICQPDTPMLVDAGCHRILADAPGTCEDQLMHAKRSLLIYELAEPHMVKQSEAREYIEHALKTARDTVAEVEERVREAEENPQYYTQEELEEMKRNHIKTYLDSFFEFENEEGDEEDDNDETPSAKPEQDLSSLENNHDTQTTATTDANHDPRSLR